MTLLESYYLHYATVNDPAALDIKKLYDNAVDYLQNFMVAAELDVQAEKVKTYFEVKNFRFTKKFFSESENELRGFALYLQDFRTPVFRCFAGESIVAFAFAVFRLKLCFEESRDRLLELSGKYQFAAMDPTRQEVCRFILCNFSLYAGDKKLLKDIYRSLKSVRKKARKSHFPIRRRSVENMLYKVCKRRLFWWFFFS